MPSNTGLYESDNESQLNSPSDGYFNPQHSPNVLVEDPSLRNHQVDKATEASQEEDRHRANEANTEHRRLSLLGPQSSSRRRTDPVFEEEGASESTPLLSFPPPAYSAAAAGDSRRVSTDRSPLGREEGPSSNPYNIMGRLDILSQNVGPQSMADQHEPRESDSGGWWQRSRRFTLGQNRRRGRFAVMLIGLMLGIFFIVDGCTRVAHVRLHQRVQ